jgi:hypothetical protein
MTPARVLGVALVLLACCEIDEPRPISPPGSSAPVDRLSQLGIFQEPLAALIAAAGVVPYDVKAPLYADRALKRRFIILPPGGKLEAPADGSSDRWQVPIGTYFVKTFYYPNDARDPGRGIHLIETRFLVRRTGGYLASTYLWNAGQTDAIASGGNVNVPVRWIDEAGLQHADEFHVPGTSYCQTCHDDRALGIRTRQLDLPGSFSDGSMNQIDFLLGQGVLDARPPAGVTLSALTGDAPTGERARSYLDANCAHCHAPQGFASGTHLYFDYEHTRSADLPVCRKVNEIEGRDRVIVPGFSIGFAGPDYYARHEDVFVGYRYAVGGPLAVGVRLPLGVRVRWLRGAFDTYAESAPLVMLTPAVEALFELALGFRVRL